MSRPPVDSAMDDVLSSDASDTDMSFSSTESSVAVLNPQFRPAVAGGPIPPAVANTSADPPRPPLASAINTIRNARARAPSRTDGSTSLFTAFGPLVPRTIWPAPGAVYEIPSTGRDQARPPIPAVITESISSSSAPRAARLPYTPPAYPIESADGSISLTGVSATFDRKVYVAVVLSDPVARDRFVVSRFDSAPSSSAEANYIVERALGVRALHTSASGELLLAPDPSLAEFNIWATASTDAAPDTICRTRHLNAWELTAIRRSDPYRSLLNSDARIGRKLLSFEDSAIGRDRRFGLEQYRSIVSSGSTGAGKIAANRERLAIIARVSRMRPTHALVPGAPIAFTPSPIACKLGAPELPEDDGIEMQIKFNTPGPLTSGHCVPMDELAIIGAPESDWNTEECALLRCEMMHRLAVYSEIITRAGSALLDPAARHRAHTLIREFCDTPTFTLLGQSYINDAWPYATSDPLIDVPLCATDAARLTECVELATRGDPHPLDEAYTQALQRILTHEPMFWYMPLDVIVVVYRILGINQRDYPTRVQFPRIIKLNRATANPARPTTGGSAPTPVLSILASPTIPQASAPVSNAPSSPTPVPARLPPPAPGALIFAPSAPVITPAVPMSEKQPVFRTRNIRRALHRALATPFKRGRCAATRSLATTLAFLAQAVAINKCSTLEEAERNKLLALLSQHSPPAPESSPTSAPVPARPRSPADIDLTVNLSSAAASSSSSSLSSPVPPTRDPTLAGIGNERISSEGQHPILARDIYNAVVASSRPGADRVKLTAAVLNLTDTLSPPSPVSVMWSPAQVQNLIVRSDAVNDNVAQRAERQSHNSEPGARSSAATRARRRNFCCTYGSPPSTFYGAFPQEHAAHVDDIDETEALVAVGRHDQREEENAGEQEYYITCLANGVFGAFHGRSIAAIGPYPRVTVRTTPCAFPTPNRMIDIIRDSALAQGLPIPPALITVDGSAHVDAPEASRPAWAGVLQHVNTPAMNNAAINLTSVLFEMISHARPVSQAHLNRGIIWAPLVSGTTDTSSTAVPHLRLISPFDLHSSSRDIANRRIITVHGLPASFAPSLGAAQHSSASFPSVLPEWGPFGDARDRGLHPPSVWSLSPSLINRVADVLGFNANSVWSAIGHAASSILSSRSVSIQDDATVAALHSILGGIGDLITTKAAVVPVRFTCGQRGRLELSSAMYQELLSFLCNSSEITVTQTLYTPRPWYGPYGLELIYKMARRWLDYYPHHPEGVTMIAACIDIEHCSSFELRWSAFRSKFTTISPPSSFGGIFIPHNRAVALSPSASSSSPSPPPSSVAPSSSRAAPKLKATEPAPTAPPPFNDARDKPSVINIDALSTSIVRKITKAVHCVQLDSWPTILAAASGALESHRNSFVNAGTVAKLRSAVAAMSGLMSCSILSASPHQLAARARALANGGRGNIDTVVSAFWIQFELLHVKPQFAHITRPPIAPGAWNGAAGLETLYKMMRRWISTSASLASPTMTLCCIAIETCDEFELCWVQYEKPLVSCNESVPMVQ